VNKINWELIDILPANDQEPPYIFSKKIHKRLKEKGMGIVKQRQRVKRRRDGGNTEKRTMYKYLIAGKAAMADIVY
jgi:hypothetical protein